MGGISPDKIVVDGVSAGSVVVDFHLVVPETVQQQGANLLATVAESTEPIAITIGSETIEAVPADSMDPIVVTAPSNIDCVGAWTDCSLTCRKVYGIETQADGAGTACDYQHGAVDTCTAGQGECPEPPATLTAAAAPPPPSTPTSAAACTMASLALALVGVLALFM
eukprot:SAG11_NODE_1235_length_5427_cov_12.391892_1_plen_167_part_00